jgi:mRNA interferase MazF
MKRGDVFWVHLGHRQGGEVRKARPAIIVSNDAANRHLNRIQVLPLTSNTSRIYPSEALVVVNGKDHKAMADQIMTISKERVGKRFGRVQAKDMEAVDQAIRIQLTLS